jgi:hypothetical protein
MKLTELILAVKDENLTKEQLEDYYSMACQLRTDISMALADYLKKEALFMASDTVYPSISSKKVAWKGSEEGQRLIELKSYSIAIKSILDGLKNRIYAKL